MNQPRHLDSRATSPTIDRANGMGIIVRVRRPQRQTRNGVPPPPFIWDYRIFTQPGAQPGAARITRSTCSSRNATPITWFQSLDHQRQRLRHGRPTTPAIRPQPRPAATGCDLRNATDDIHPIHLHRHTFEITHYRRHTPPPACLKTSSCSAATRVVELDFIADQPGLSLLHCHQQLHMDFGFMALLNTA